MATYEHLNEVKQAESLPQKDIVGACLTCRFWDTDESRDESLAPLLALCVQPDLKPYGLVVSGASGCNKWDEQPDIEPEAKAYAKRGEKK